MSDYPKVIWPKSKTFFETATNKQIFNVAIGYMLVALYRPLEGRELMSAFVEVLSAGMEACWISDYFDTWHEFKSELKESPGMSPEEKYELAWGYVHDTAMSIESGLKSEGFGSEMDIDEMME